MKKEQKKSIDHKGLFSSALSSIQPDDSAQVNTPKTALAESDCEFNA